MGQGFEQNYEKALELYMLAAEGGNDDAMESIGEFYENGTGVEQSIEKAVEYYQ